jgi:hypothetical protein
VVYVSAEMYSQIHHQKEKGACMAAYAFFAYPRIRLLSETELEVDVGTIGQANSKNIG